MTPWRFQGASRAMTDDPVRSRGSVSRYFARYFAGGSGEGAGCGVDGAGAGAVDPAVAGAAGGFAAACCGWAAGLIQQAWI